MDLLLHRSKLLFILMQAITGLWTVWLRHVNFQDFCVFRDLHKRVVHSRGDRARVAFIEWGGSLLFKIQFHRTLEDKVEEQFSLVASGVIRFVVVRPQNLNLRDSPGGRTNPGIPE